MDYEKLDGNTIVVPMTRKIELGRTVRMVPSDGYLGVDFGVAKIIGMCDANDLEKWNILDGHDSAADAIRASVDGFMDAELSLWDLGTTDYSERLEQLQNQPWIAYEYTRGSDDDVWVFPLELFLSHSLSYY